ASPGPMRSSTARLRTGDSAPTATSTAAAVASPGRACSSSWPSFTASTCGCPRTSATRSVIARARRAPVSEHSSGPATSSAGPAEDCQLAARRLAFLARGARSLARVGSRVAGLGIDRQRDVHGRSAPRLALDAKLSAMGEYEVLHDGEPEAGPAELA